MTHHLWFPESAAIVLSGSWRGERIHSCSPTKLPSPALPSIPMEERKTKRGLRTRAGTSILSGRGGHTVRWNCRWEHQTIHPGCIWFPSPRGRGQGEGEECPRKPNGVMKSPRRGTEQITRDAMRERGYRGERPRIPAFERHARPGRRVHRQETWPRWMRQETQAGTAVSATNASRTGSSSADASAAEPKVSTWKAIAERTSESASS